MMILGLSSGSLLVIVSVLERAPVACGTKPTWMVEVSVAFNVPDRHAVPPPMHEIGNSVGESETIEKLSGAAPAALEMTRFWTVAACPTCVVPANVTELATVSMGTWPVQFTVTVRGLFGSSLRTVSVVLRRPEPLGVHRMPKLLELLPLIVFGTGSQLCPVQPWSVITNEKSVALPPVRSMAATTGSSIVSTAAPLLPMERLLVIGVPTGVLPTLKGDDPNVCVDW